MRASSRGGAVAGLLLAASSFGALPEHDPKPGGIAVIVVAEGTARPDVRFGDRKALLMRSDDRWYAVVGVPLSQSAGSASLTIAAADGGETVVEFDVLPHSYREQRLSVERSYVEPEQQQLDRIFGERKIINAALNNFRDAEIESLSLPAPVPGRRSESFGFRRFFNDQPRSPHSGMDIAANLGTTIVAPRAGVVAATGDFFFNGNTVLIDHGQGFVTMYCHLDRIDVEQSQSVEPGDPLGVVGATGRVTGPHLHFGTYLTGTAIDPALVLEAE